VQGSRVTPKNIADHIRRVLKDGGSAPHAEEVQRFFKEEVQSRGWYTAEVRKLAVRFRRSILKERGQDFLLGVADDLFSGNINEERSLAVYLLQPLTANFGQSEFRRFEGWLTRISNWSDHDALVYYLLGPMIVARPERKAHVFRWAKAKDRWHRRAACVALIQGTRQKMFFVEIMRLTQILLSDTDDMVQKGLGWLLRETVKFNARPAVRYLLKIRNRTPRLVLRTACETLPEKARKAILANEAVVRGNS
jgi:3-methyladenine DNA glycosylase AlkD